MEEKKTWAERLKNETLWLNISIGLFAVSVVGFFAALVFVCYASGDNAKVSVHLDFLKTFGTALFAFLTFSTVVWRGLVGEFQAREQQRANDQKDEENTAKLFLDGTKCISQADSPQKYAGLAALEALVSSSASKYSDAAMNILADVVTAEITKTDKSKSFEQARLAMKIGAERSRFSNRDIHSSSVHHETTHVPLFGFNQLTYEGGRAPYVPGKFYTFNRRTNFKKVDFFSDKIDTSNDVSISSCTLRYCFIEQIDVSELIKNIYLSCDFSNTIVRTEAFNFFYLPHEIECLNNTLNACYYRIDSPPTGDGAHLIIPYLEARDRPTA